jgi:hypothetical protein
MLDDVIGGLQSCAVLFKTRQLLELWGAQVLVMLHKHRAVIGRA